MITKICTKCGRELPATTEYFHKHKTGKYGLHATCKECKISESKKYYNQNKERHAENGKKYREEHREELREYGQKYYQEHKETHAENGKKWAKKNREKIRKLAKKYRLENPERSRQASKRYRDSHKEKTQKRHKKYREENREKIAKYNATHYRDNKKHYLEYGKTHYQENKKEYYRQTKNYREKNKEQYCIYAQTRIARIKMLKSDLTVEDWIYAQNAFGWRCAYCGKRSERLHQEHFIPVSKNGEYTKQNIIPACQSCNSSKNNKPFKEWYPEQPFYSKDRERFIYEHFEKVAQDND